MHPSSTTTTSTQDVIAAGDFGSWLTHFRASLRGEAGSDVPCGDCVGCCVSSYYIPVRPTDTEALTVIPATLLVSAPGQSQGHAMLGYLSDGTCHMLSAGKCSIYAQRPQTCRDYDCRIFAAAGIDAGNADKHVINKRVREWRFTYASDADESKHRAVLAAAAFIRSKRSSFPNGRVPTAPTGIAVLAIKTYKVFLNTEAQALTEAETAYAIIHASGAFDAGADA